MKVRAVGTADAKRRKKWSEEVTLSTMEYSQPKAPAEPSCSGQQQNALELVLAKPESVDDITALELATQRVPTEGEEEPDWEYQKLSPVDISCTVQDLLPGQRYRCMLRAKAAVWGPWSDVMEATTSAAPVPTPLPAEASSTTDPEEAEEEEALEDYKVSPDPTLTLTPTPILTLTLTLTLTRRVAEGSGLSPWNGGARHRS